MKQIMKNIDKSCVLTLKDEVAYLPHQVVSKTLIQNDALSIHYLPLIRMKKLVRIVHQVMLWFIV